MASVTHTKKERLQFRRSLLPVALICFFVLSRDTFAASLSGEEVTENERSSNESSNNRTSEWNRPKAIITNLPQPTRSSNPISTRTEGPQSSVSTTQVLQNGEIGTTRTPDLVPIPVNPSGNLTPDSGRNSQETAIDENKNLIPAESDTDLQREPFYEDLSLEITTPTRNLEKENWSKFSTKQFLSPSSSLLSFSPSPTIPIPVFTTTASKDLAGNRILEEKKDHKKEKKHLESPNFMKMEEGKDFPKIKPPLSEVIFLPTIKNSPEYRKSLADIQNTIKQSYYQVFKNSKLYPKSYIPLKPNNQLEDPFLSSASEVLSKNISGRISEIISMKSKPEKFKEMLKIAQQSDNFEDPFNLSPILRESSFDNLLATDSSAFSEGQKKLYRSSFRGISNEPKRYKQRKKEPGRDTNKTRLIHKNANTNYHRPIAERVINPIPSTLSTSNVYQLQNVLAKGETESDLNKDASMDDYPNIVIYKEISGPLHIDSSIDDIKDDYETQERQTEVSDQYLPNINTTRENFLEPKLHFPNTDLGSNSSNIGRDISKNIILSATDGQRLVTSIYYENSTDFSPPTNKKVISSTSQQRKKGITQSANSGNTTWEKETPFRILSTLTNKSVSNLVNNNDYINIAIDSKEVRMMTPGEEEKELEISDSVEVEDKHPDEFQDKYYSFFGYKEQESSTEEEKSETTMSLGDHNRMILMAQAERMAQVMNSSVAPCEDFYEYACGQWAHVYPLEDKALDNTFDRLREGLDEVLRALLEEQITDRDTNATKVAKTLYRGCMNQEQIEARGVDPLKELLRELGGWPVLEGDAWNETAFDWVTLMAKLRNYNNDILLSEWVAADITNSSNHIIQLDQPELGLPGREYFMSAGDQSYRMAYMELMLKTCDILGAAPETAFADMINVLQFEKQLAKILTPAEERRNLSAVHRRLTVRELQHEIPQIAWNRYLEIVTGTPDHLDRYVIVFAMKYIHKLIDLIKNTNKRTVSNYLMWRFVKNRMNNLGRQALEAKQEFIQILFGSKSQPERWLSCVSYVNGNLGYVLGALFVSKYYPQSSKTDSEEMIRLIRESFIETINESEWMKESTRKVAEKKVYAMVRNVGYPQYILNSTYMDSIYSELNFDESDHFWNVIKMLQFHARSTHSLIHKPVNRTEWTTTPAVVNAYYSRSKNMIMFPAGILQPPFYHPAFPRSLNFGGIGVVIGHEISHGFDDRGRQFDEFGNLQQWWTEEDVSQFYYRATCMLDQYSNYKVDSVGLKINAVNTLGENIADNAGLKIAYKAYRRWKATNEENEVSLPNLNLTHDQLFFLNFGQIWCEVNSPEAMLTKIRGGQHSPNKYRVIGTLSNSDEFTDAFHCPKGSLMNPHEKCQVW